MVGDVVEAVVRAKDTTGAVKFDTTFHFQAPLGSSLVPDLTAFASDFEDFTFAGMLHMLTADYVADSIQFTVVAGPSIGTQYIDGGVAGTVGSLAVATADFSVCTLINRTDGTASRKGHGRIFLSPIPAATYNLAGIQVVAPTGLASMLAAILLGCSAGGGEIYMPCLFNKAAGTTRPVLFSSHSLRCGIRRHRRGTI